MEKVRIALGSNDGKNIVSSHMGDAEYFYVFDLFKDGRSNFVENRKNTSQEQEGKHGREEKMNAVTKMIEDSEVIIARKMSPNFKKISANTRFQPVIIEADAISDIIEKVAISFDEIVRLVEQRREGKRLLEVPILG